MNVFYPIIAMLTVTAIAGIKEIITPVEKDEGRIEPVMEQYAETDMLNWDDYGNPYVTYTGNSQLKAFKEQ